MYVVSFCCIPAYSTFISNLVSYLLPIHFILKYQIVSCMHIHLRCFSLRKQVRMTVYVKLRNFKCTRICCNNIGNRNYLRFAVCLASKRQDWGRISWTIRQQSQWDRNLSIPIFDFNFSLSVSGKSSITTYIFNNRSCNSPTRRCILKKSWTKIYCV